MSFKTLICCTILVISAQPGLADDVNRDHLKMALVNMRCRFSADDKANIQANLDRHLYFIDKVAAEGAEFVGFPEMSLNGYKCAKKMPFLKLEGPEVQVLAKKAMEKKIYVCAGMAQIDDQGKCWNTQFVIGPDGKLLGRHHKIWLTEERVFQGEPGSEHTIVEVKGTKIGLFTCADGTDYLNIKALADQGAKIVYGAHANTTGGTISGWYAFRQRFAGRADGKLIESPTSNNAGKAQVPAVGWCDQLNVYAAMHNHAALFNTEYDPPEHLKTSVDKRWASGAWVIGPNGETMAQMPASSNPADSKEFILIYNLPLSESKALPPE